MENINAFRTVVQEKKIFEDLSIFSLFGPLLGTKRVQSLHLNKSKYSSLKNVSYQVWLKWPSGS